LKAPLWNILGITDQSEENTSVRIGGVETEIRSQYLQNLSEEITSVTIGGVETEI
jgi:hypothetical protein